MTGLKYDHVYDELAGEGRVCGRGTYLEAWEPVLLRLGFTKLAPNRTLKDTVENLRDSPAVLRIPRHAIALVDGVLHDEMMQPPGVVVFNTFVWLPGARLTVRECELHLKHVRIYE